MVAPSPTVRRRRLGMELRRLREAAGLTCEDVGKRLDCDGTRISRIEKGRIGVSTGDVRELLDVYKVQDEHTREALVTIARDARKRGWWRDFHDVLPSWFEEYVGLETEAATLRIYATQFVPGLLQTAGYARAIFRAGQPSADPDEIERLVEWRLARQKILTSKEEPTRLWVVLGEAVLRSRVGSEDVMHDQLHHLVEMTELPNMTIQVLPFGVDGHARAKGPFTLLEFPEPADPDVVYLEHLTGSLFLEGKREVDRYTLAFDHLQVDAFGHDQSIELITKLTQGQNRL